MSSISPNRLQMEILNEGFIPTRTIRSTTQIILGFRPFRKKRRISKPREFNAKNGTPTRGALPFPPHRCHAQKNYGQNVEQNVSQTTHQLQPIRHPGPIKLRPWQKIQEQHQAHKLGTQRLKSLKKPIIHLHKNYYFAHYTRNTNEISNESSNGRFYNKNRTNLHIAANKKKKKWWKTTRIKYSSNGFRIYIWTNEHHRWGVLSNIYRIFPSNINNINISK